MAAMNVSPPPWAGIVENLQLAGGAEMSEGRRS
jgi:hypothetical protein